MRIHVDSGNFVSRFVIVTESCCCFVYRSIGHVVSETIQMFSLDVCGLVCSYVVHGIAKQGVSPISLPLFEQPMTFKYSYDKRFQISCDRTTAQLYLLAPDRIFQYNISGKVTQCYHLPVKCGYFTVWKNKMFLSNEFISSELMTIDLIQCEFSRIELSHSARIYGVYMREDGFLALCDVSHDQIVIYNLDGSLDCIFGRYGEKDGEFITPIDIGSSSKQEWIVIDYQGNRIQVFDVKGQFIRTFGTRDNCQWPISMAMDREDNVYVLPQYGRQLSVFQSHNGTFVTYIDLPCSTASDTLTAHSICIDCEGRILVVTTDGRVHALGFEA